MHNLSSFLFGTPLGRRTRLGFSIVFILPVLLALLVVTAGALLWVKQVTRSSTEMAASKDTRSRQDTTLRSASEILGYHLVRDLKGEGTTARTAFEASLRDLFDAEQTSAPEAVSRLDNPVNLTISFFRAETGTPANPTEDMVAAINTPFANITPPEHIPQLAQSLVGGGTFIGLSWHYRLRIEWEQTLRGPNNETTVTTPDQSRLERDLFLFLVPSQFALQSEHILLVGGYVSEVDGSVIGPNVHLYNANVKRTVLAHKDLWWSNGAKIAGTPLPPVESVVTQDNRNTINQTLFQELVRARPQWQNRLPINVLGQTTRSLLLPLGDRSKDSEGVAGVFKRPPDSTPYQVLSHPYYQTNHRILLTGLNPAFPPPWSSVPIRVSNGQGTMTERISETNSNGAALPFGSFRTVPHPDSSIGGNLILLEINPAQIPVTNGVRTLFVDLMTTDTTFTRRRAGITFRNVSSLDTPISIVSANPVYFTQTWTPGRPNSVLAPDIRFGLGWTPQVTFTGQRIAAGEGSTLNGSTFPLSNGSLVPIASNSLHEVSGASQLPPVFLKHLFIASR